MRNKPSNLITHYFHGFRLLAKNNNNLQTIQTQEILDNNNLQTIQAQELLLKDFLKQYKTNLKTEFNISNFKIAYTGDSTDGLVIVVFKSKPGMKVIHGLKQNYLKFKTESQDFELQEIENGNSKQTLISKRLSSYIKTYDEVSKQEPQVYPNLFWIEEEEMVEELFDYYYAVIKKLKLPILPFFQKEVEEIDPLITEIRQLTETINKVIDQQNELKTEINYEKFYRLEQSKAIENLNNKNERLTEAIENLTQITGFIAAKVNQQEIVVEKLETLEKTIYKLEKFEHIEKTIENLNKINEFIGSKIDQQEILMEKLETLEKTKTKSNDYKMNRLYEKVDRLYEKNDDKQRLLTELLISRKESMESIENQRRPLLTQPQETKININEQEISLHREQRRNKSKRLHIPNDLKFNSNIFLCLLKDLQFILKDLKKNCTLKEIFSDDLYIKLGMDDYQNLSFFCIYNLNYEMIQPTSIFKMISTYYSKLLTGNALVPEAFLVNELRRGNEFFHHVKEYYGRMILESQGYDLCETYLDYELVKTFDENNLQPA